MRTTYPQVDSPERTNGNAAVYDADVLREENAALKYRIAVQDQRITFLLNALIGTAVFAIFELGVLIVAGWRL